MTRTPSPEPILSRVLHEAWEFSKTGRRFLAVFDLDSTLYDLTLRVSTIIDEFALKPENIARFPAECAGLARVKIEPTDWGLEAPLGRAGLASNTPFFKALHDYWVACFFSDAYMLHDEPLPGAVEYVQELHQVGAHIMYLTGRDIPRMGRGSQESLRLHKFPLVLPTARLVLKPRADLDDAQFKLEVLQEAEDEYERIWLFENEPVNLNLVARHCPDIGLIFIDSTHSGREQLEPTLEAIKHFEADIAEFRNKR
jgi:hypothetical protein